MRHQFFSIVFFSSVILALAVPGTAWSADVACNCSALLASAFEAEARGDFTERERLLQEALNGDAAAAARAHLGMVDVGTKKHDWKTIDECIAASAKDRNVARYEQVRQKTADTAEGNFELARWCVSNKMPKQARAHLTRLLEFAPDHAAAREALGFVRVGDAWVSPVEIKRMQARAASRSESIERHQKTLGPLVARLKSKNPKEREAASTALLAHRDPTMVGAIETALDSTDPSISKLVVEWMGQVDAVESSHVLARYSLLHPDQAVRSMAMDQLATRPLHDFVPEMLGMASSPVAMTIQPSYDPQGRLVGFRQAFGREGMGENDIQIIDREFRRVLDGGSLDGIMAADAEAEARIRQQALAEVQSRVMQMQQQNAVIEQVNARVSDVIARVVDGVVAPSHDEMWQWWDQYNETEFQEGKTDSVKWSYTVTTVPVSGPPEALETPGGTPGRRHECFVAGTPVITRVGPKAIETILPGDEVLNRDLTTGALRWKPVLKATKRPPAMTVAITVDAAGDGSETFRCSPGHLFWVSGIGWKKASELEANEVLHAAKTPVRVSRVDQQTVAQTYNLEVADSPNYFVGRSMILTHDVTPRGTNRQTIPGQDYVNRLSDQPQPRKAAGR